MSEPGDPGARSTVPAGSADGGQSDGRCDMRPDGVEAARVTGAVDSGTLCRHGHRSISAPVSGPIAVSGSDLDVAVRRRRDLGSDLVPVHQWILTLCLDLPGYVDRFAYWGSLM